MFASGYEELARRGSPSVPILTRNLVHNRSSFSRYDAESKKELEQEHKYE